MARFYDFGCAPVAAADGYGPKGHVEKLTQKEAREKFDTTDVAVVKGWSSPSGVCEFFVMQKTVTTDAAAATGLISWIESHGNHAIDNGDGSLTVTSIECKDGIAREIEDVIPATLPAARDLLGY